MIGKNIIVTGATSGIGLGICKQLVNAGAFVIGIGRNLNSIVELTAVYSSEKIIFKSFDLFDLGEIELLIDGFICDYGKIDGFVHCAGIEETVPLSMYKIDKIRRIFEVNVFSGVEILRVISKKKYSNDFASFVFLSSVMGNLGQSGKVGYCATKAALLGVVKSSALELAKRGLRVNAVLPGIVLTPLTEKLFESLAQEQVDKIKDMHPLGLGEIEDLVPTVMFLLSDQSKWITGQSIVVDGGYSIQ